MNDKYYACKVLLTTCSDCKKDENLLFVTDPFSYEVARMMWEAAADYPNKSMIVMDERTMHGQDPNPMVAAAMAKADVIFGATKFSLFHTQARRDAVAGGARFVNMVDYRLSMFESGGLFADFEKEGEKCTYLADAMMGDTITITTERGTHITSSIKGRKTVPQYGRSLKRGDSSSPPDIECAVCAVEGTASGVAYIDGSIPHPELGLITDEIKLVIKESKIVSITGGPQAETLSRIMRDFNDDKVYYIGELGVGLNSKCSLNGLMLEDEGCARTMHFGCGSNTGFFGTIECPIHLDLVFREPTIAVDGKIIVEKGEVVGL
ncbi:MAG: aminopeptidase [Christensenellales bacterium]